MKYRYSVEGAAAEGQTWSDEGEIETAQAGDFAFTPSMALRQAFQKLTQGRARYGNPGVGCSGPYRVTKLVIEEVL